MTVVVADSSPLNYLVLIDAITVLAELYGRVVIPDVVAAELSDAGAPRAVREWASTFPPWIQVLPSPESGEGLDKLDDRERAAILLALAQQTPVLLLIDEADGRMEAARCLIPVVELWAYCALRRFAISSI